MPLCSGWPNIASFGASFANNTTPRAPFYRAAVLYRAHSHITFEPPIRRTLDEHAEYLKWDLEPAPSPVKLCVTCEQMII